MTILEQLSTLNPEVGLWLAGIAASAGLALVWRWRIAQRSQRHRALQVLGYGNAALRTVPAGIRYAAIVTAAVVTVFVLTPASSGIGDIETSADMAHTEPAPTVIVVNLGSESGGTVVVQGVAVEIRLMPQEPSTANVTPPSSPMGDPVTASEVITVPVYVLPEGME
ncbi:MAG: hypothetical protein IT318_08410 [Anaerolineales bacterium]|nr:hypothetical protein [Anaerolineales bacterium]